jgi:hypothetical protein
MPKEQPATALDYRDPHQLALSVTPEKYTRALMDLYEDARQHGGHSVARLLVIRACLFAQGGYTDAESKRALKKAGYPRPVEHALMLYAKMQQLISVCVPKGSGTGPSVYIDTLEDGESKRLPPDQRALDRKVRRIFSRGYSGCTKMTLRGLAGEMLTDDGEPGFSRRNLPRVIDALKKYSFPDVDPRRDDMIATVNAFNVKAIVIEEQTHSSVYASFVSESIATLLRGLPPVFDALKELPKVIGVVASMPDWRTDLMAHLAPRVHEEMRLASAHHAKVLAEVLRSREFNERLRKQLLPRKD